MSSGRFIYQALNELGKGVVHGLVGDHLMEPLRRVTQKTDHDASAAPVHYQVNVKDGATGQHRGKRRHQYRRNVALIQGGLELVLESAFDELTLAFAGVCYEFKHLGADGGRQSFEVVDDVSHPRQLIREILLRFLVEDWTRPLAPW